MGREEEMFRESMNTRGGDGHISVETIGGTEKNVNSGNRTGQLCNASI